MRFLKFFFNHMVQKYQNEIAPILYYRISTKTNERDLRIPNLQPSDWKSPYWMTLHILLCIIFEGEVHDGFSGGVIQQLRCLLIIFILIIPFLILTSHQNGPCRRRPAGMVLPLLLQLVWKFPLASTELDTGGRGVQRQGYYSATHLQCCLRVVVVELRKVG